MNIEDISNTLPNGFHDAYLQRLSLDYAKHEAVFTLKIWDGDPDADNPAQCDAYRSGRLILNGLLFCVIEPPDTGLDESDSALWITADSSDFDELKTNPKLPEIQDGFRHWFFISTLNCFMYVAAKNASFEWET